MSTFLVVPDASVLLKSVLPWNDQADAEKALLPRNATVLLGLCSERESIHESD
jgi:hypothetical protein